MTLVKALYCAPLLISCAMIASCRDTIPPLMVQAFEEEPRVAMDLCWPLVAGQCEQRDMNQNEQNRVVTQGQNILGYGADPFCGQVYDRVNADINNRRIFIWTVGTPQYDPANFTGDRHNGADVTHLTAGAFANNETLQRTLIHEAVHALGIMNDGDATMWEDACLGVTD